MWCPELPSRQARPLRVIPCFGQVAENSSDGASVPALSLPGEEGGDVLHDDVAGSKLANDPGELGPKTRAGAVKSGASSGVAEVLAREAAADEINDPELLRADLPNVAESLSAGEVSGEDGPAVGILLDLPGDAHPGPLEAEVEPADTGKEASDIHDPPLDRSPVALRTGK